MSHPVLFGAEPIARGQGQVESLSGFFARICLARYLTATRVFRAFVLNRCPSGLFPSRPSRVGNFLSRSSARFDLQPVSALPFAAALQDLTLISELHALTISTLAPLFNPPSLHQLGRHRKRWCPACLAASNADGGPLYEPLLWRFSLVERCPVHRFPLLDCCPVCDHHQPLITQGVPIGYCVRCGHALHQGVTLSSPEEASFDASDRWAMWRSSALSRLVAWSSVLQDDPRACPAVSTSGFRRLLEHALNSPPDPSVGSRLALAYALGVQTGVFYRVLSGERRPSLPVFLDVCMQLGADPVRVARGDYTEGERTWPPMDLPGLSGFLDPWRLALEARDRNAARRHPTRARALDEYIADPNAVDLAGAMRVHKAGPGWLSNSFPLRYARARQLREERFARQRQALRQQCDDVLDAEISLGASRTLQEVASSIGLTFQKIAYYSPERAAKLGALRASRYSTRRPGLREKAKVALQEAIDRVEGPALQEVARSLSVSGFALSSLFPDLCRRLVELRRHEHEARYARYSAVMQIELRRSRPRGVWAVAKQLGVTPVALRRANGALYANLVEWSSRRGEPARRRRENARRARADAVAARKAKLRTAIERELRSETPRSPHSVAKEAGTVPSVLKHHCQAEYVQLQELRLAKRAEFLEGLGRMLEEESLLPHPREVSAFARDMYVAVETLESTVPKSVTKLRQALERKSRRPRLSLFPKGDGPFLAVLEAEALAQNPRSVAALARAFGTSSQTLSNVSRPAVERLLAARARRGLSHSRIVAVLEAEALAAEPRSVSALARSLGTTPQTLSCVSRSGVERLLAARAGPAPREAELLAALEAEVSAPNPRPLVLLARSLGTNPQKLVRLSRPAVDRLLAARRGPVPNDAQILEAIEAEAVSPEPRSVRALARALGVSSLVFSRISRPAVERLLAARSAASPSNRTSS